MEHTVINPPKDPELERPWLYGFLAGIPSPLLPPESVLDYIESADPKIRAAFESGRDLAERHAKWSHDFARSYYTEPLKEISERILRIAEGEGR